MIARNFPMRLSPRCPGHEALALGPLVTWLSATVPLPGKRGEPHDGLLFADCRACLEDTGIHFTITRSVGRKS